MRGPRERHRQSIKSPASFSLKLGISAQMNAIVEHFGNFFAAKMNFAARHRNVYLDTVGGDPYGKAN